MLATVNGLPLLKLELTEPRTGAWSAMLEADSKVTLGSSLALLIDGEPFVGTVQQGDVEAERYKAKLVGGGGGLGKQLEARHYYGATIGAVLIDICREAGETIDPSILPTIMLKAVPRWSRLQGDAQSAIRQVADFLGVQWRITRLGLLWLGQDAWQPLVPPPKLIEVDFDPHARVRVVAYDGLTERPVVRPGITLDGERIATAVLKLDGGTVRHEVYTDETKGAGGLVAQVLRKAVELLTPKIAQSRFYPGRVAAQAPDGLATILLDDRLVAGKWKGIDRVPLLHGLPGVTVSTAPGARLRVLWDAGDPSRVRAALWDDGAPALEVNLAVLSTLRLGSKNATQFVLRGTAHAAALDTFLTALNAYAIAIKPIADPGETATPALTTAIIALKAHLASGALSSRVRVAD